MGHRRKDHVRLLPVGAAAAAAALAVGGAAWIWATGNDASGADGPRTRAASPDPRIDCAKKGQVPGSGSTAQQNAVKYWIRQYQNSCPGVQIAYNPIGSGAGVAQFMRGATAFGGTDGALKPDDVEQSRAICHGGHGIDLPLLGGPIAISYNLADVDHLVLDAPTLAKIFNAKIKNWNDPQIRKLNPGAKLPDLPIQPVHRSDDAGTTQNFTAYLAAAAPLQWPYPVSKTWPAKAGNSADGSDGVAATVAGSQGTIGYFELSFSASQHLPLVSIDTGALEPVEPSPKTASAGIATAQIVGQGKDVPLKLDYATHDAGAYPIVLVTYEIVCDKNNQAETLPALKSFLTYAAGDVGQRSLPGIYYAPLPANVATRVREVIRTLS